VAAVHPFTIANFRAYWLARLTMTLAQYAMLLIIGWQVYNMARDSGLSVAEASGQLALVGLLQFIPLFVLTPIVGFAADRFDRRNIGRLTVLLQLVCACILGWFTWQSAINLPIILAVAVLLGIARAFSGPALSALAPNLVPKEALPTAIALSSIGWQVGMLGGPAIAPILYRITPALPYAIAAVLMTISLIALSFISKVAQPAMPKDVRPIGQIRDGMRYVLRNKMVLGAITLDLIAVFLAGAGALLPAFARDILMVGEEGLALLAPAPGIGAALIALWFSFKPLKNNVGPKMLMAVAVFGFATIGFGLSRNLALSVFMLMLIGAADMFSVYIRQSLIQLHTPDDKRGRVSSVSMLTISASNEGGDAFSGGLAFLIGPVAAVIAGGASAVVTVAIWSRVFPVLRTTKTFDPPEEVLREDQSQTRQES
jgi:MFS family permease